MISLTSPYKTRAHSWPAWLKLLGLCFATATLFAIKSPAIQLFPCVAVLGLYAIPGRAFFLSGLRQLKLLWPFILIVGLWHLWTGDYALGATIVLRMITAVGLANLVTMTTRLSDMTDVVHMVTRPLKPFGLNPKILEFSIALVIRLTPVLVGKGMQLADAWKARSPRATSWRIILPFAVLALDDADHIAEALRARGGFNTPEET
ncbi:MAG: energy-coupling factor transporter transmembrane component T [Roseovarius sp.]|nr:energy-coupling factor transporter transmembrane component T [Roseovarius sp.]MCY4207255.1 energy-coupling factor transporter transmembrane component T [Roseovarius sp.]MCY4291358.1 energy-coupling factor transporter transmembrane component T [Roseovarius sp.]MCY4315889.1 energy-coupling factor transporter transmembrane component T [Roseovarius sp.]